VKQKVRINGWWKIDWVEVFHQRLKDCRNKGASFHSCNKTRVEGDCAIEMYFQREGMLYFHIDLVFCSLVGSTYP
jgi:hypothetical protein